MRIESPPFQGAALRSVRRAGARFASLLLGGLFVMIAPGLARAAQTTVHQNPSEISLDASGGVLDQLYGLSNLTRVEDFSSTPNDQIWFQVTSGLATAEARYASLTHRFGYFDGSGSVFTQLFQVSGAQGILVGGPSAIFSVAGPTFRFGLKVVSGSTVVNTWSSQESENTDGAKDHLVVWRIAGPGNRYALAWEDLAIGTPAPSAPEPDYNDLVIEVSGVAPFGCGNGVIDPGEDCDDGNTANGDCCSETCLAAPTGTSCADSNLCNGAETCGAGGVCGAGVPLVCNDGNACTDDSCNASTGCVATPNTAPCSDGSACTVGDACSGGSCAPGAPLACDDGNVCTDDSCNASTGCVATPNAVTCDDGSACTVADQCSGGTCLPGVALVCDDTNSCTTDSCEPASGCQHVNDPNVCAPPTESIQPIVECVVENGPGDFTAHFGYLNANSSPVTISAGTDNGFSPAPVDRGQVTTFDPGRSPFYPASAFQVDFDGSNLTWTIHSPNGTTLATMASFNSSRCPRPPNIVHQYSLCYGKVNQVGAPPPANQLNQSIEDVFELKAFDLNRTRMLCTPVSVTYRDQLNPVIDPDTHLLSRGVTLTKTKPAQPPFDPLLAAHKNIEVGDLFGVRRLDITRVDQQFLPAAVCNPATQTCPADPAQLSMVGIGTEEFKCYRARRAAGEAKFPKGVNVLGVDPFQSRVYRVTEPKLLCTRANRAGNDPAAVSDLVGRVCYGLTVPSRYCEPGSPAPYALSTCHRDSDCGGSRCMFLPRPLLSDWILGVRTRADAVSQIVTTLYPKLLCVPADIAP